MITRIGQYPVHGVLGSGASGTVYQAYQEALDRVVAIKQLSPALVGQPGFLDRFRTEAQLMAHLDNPNCVKVIDYFELEGNAYLVSEFVDGASLRQVLARAGRLTAEQSLGILKGAVSGLRDAHAVGVIHRDIKPDNILVDREGTSSWRTLVWRPSPPVADPAPPAGVSQGSPLYMSPEQVRGLPLDHRTDIYSCGAMLFELLAGTAPFQADNPLAAMRKHVTEPVPDPRTAYPALPAPVAAVVMKAMAKDPSARHQTATDLMQDLQQGADQSYGAGWESRAAMAGLVAATMAAAAGAAVAGGATAAAAATPAAGATTATAHVGAAGVSKSGGIISGKVLAAGGAVLVIAIAAVIAYLLLHQPPALVAFAGLRNGRDAGLFVVKPDGSGVKLLPQTGSGDTQPTFSPDQKRIAFRRESGANPGIYVINIDGSGAQQLAGGHQGNVPDGSPAWSPDGKQITFVRFSPSRNPPREYELMVMNADGSNQAAIQDLQGSTQSQFHPSWSPDSKWIAYSSGSAPGDNSSWIYLVHPDGSGRLRMPPADLNRRYNGLATASLPSWSPDGKSIAYEGLSEGSKAGVFIMNTDGSGARKVTDNAGFNSAFAPAWSPDSKQLVVLDLECSKGCLHVILVNIDGSNRHAIASDGEYRDVAWASMAAPLAGVGALPGPEASPSPTPSSVPSPLAKTLTLTLTVTFAQPHPRLSPSQSPFR